MIVLNDLAHATRVRQLGETHLNADGTVESTAGATFGVVTNAAGSEFFPRSTGGAYMGVTANFAFGGGFGIAAGVVADGMNNWTPYFSLNANIGYILGVGTDTGLIIPTDDKKQFHVEDFKGNSSSYSGGYGPVSATYGGSVDHEQTTGAALLKPKNFGRNENGYKFFSGGASWGPKEIKAGGAYSFSTTWLH